MKRILRCFSDCSIQKRFIECVIHSLRIYKARYSLDDLTLFGSLVMSFSCLWWCEAVFWRQYFNNNLVSTLASQMKLHNLKIQLTLFHFCPKHFLTHGETI